MSERIAGSPTKSAWWGSYRLVVSSDLLDFVERTFVEPAAAAERGAVRADALHEIEGAEISLEADGTLLSRSHGVELLRTRIPLDAFATSKVVFEKAPGLCVELELVEADIIIARHPGRPLMIFRRAS